MRIPFYWVDVFAAEPLTGNPLPVVPDADELSVETMRAIAQEFNQSETTFIVRPDSEGADHRLRSFTPGGVEVLGAGHNAMGAWLWLSASGRLDARRDDYVQQIGSDLLSVRVARAPGSGARVTMEQSSARFLDRFEDLGLLAQALGLRGEDLSEGHAEVVSTGAEHLLVRARTMRAVDAAQPDTGRLRELLAAAGAEGCYLYTIDVGADSGLDAYARFFNPTVGIVEDPATGTAAGPLAALLVRDGRALSGAPVTIEQGRKLGRPSRIVLELRGSAVSISGTGIVVAEGVLHL